MNRLKELRDSFGWSLRDLEKKADVNIANLSRFERGKSNSQVVTLEKVAKALQVTTDYLLGVSNEGYILTYEENEEDKTLVVPDNIYEKFLSLNIVVNEDTYNKMIHRLKSEHKGLVKTMQWSNFAKTMFNAQYQLEQMGAKHIKLTEDDKHDLARQVAELLKKEKEELDKH